MKNKIEMNQKVFKIATYNGKMFGIAFFLLVKINSYVCMSIDHEVSQEQTRSSTNPLESNCSIPPDEMLTITVAKPYLIISQDLATGVHKERLTNYQEKCPIIILKAMLHQALLDSVEIQVPDVPEMTENFQWRRWMIDNIDGFTLEYNVNRWVIGGIVLRNIPSIYSFTPAFVDTPSYDEVVSLKATNDKENLEVELGLANGTIFFVSDFSGETQKRFFSTAIIDLLDLVRDTSTTELIEIPWYPRRLKPNPWNWLSELAIQFKLEYSRPGKLFNSANIPCNSGLSTKLSNLILPTLDEMQYSYEIEDRRITLRTQYRDTSKWSFQLNGIELDDAKEPSRFSPTNGTLVYKKLAESSGC
ncbi:uncharacterized protein LOC129747051 [Uranotaenia lowii]|uniref:uncharacterized protein LOC129747051 n=1 Tax=Uranotaenia lowii TaxID=190385 RepID=UPI0024783F00|nr:uncharacterized protein LOC129747051 [Uranotaenia lowii]